MDTQLNTLRQRFPLSPRKFWKKFIPKMFSLVIYSTLFVGVPLSLLLFSLPSSQEPIPFLLQPAFLVSFLAATLIIFWVIIPLLYAWYLRVYIRRYYYDSNDDFITIKKGVFMPTEIHVQYQKIQDVYVDQDFLDRLLGIYDVHIASATITSGIEAHIDGVDAATAEGLKNFLLNKIRGGSGQSKLESNPNHQNQVVKFNLTEEVSSKTYPISRSWYVKSIIGAVLNSVALAILLGVGAVAFRWTLIAAWPIVLLIAGLNTGFVIFREVISARNFRFQFLPEYILLYEEFISSQEKHVPYNTVQDVVITQGVIDRLFGLCTVYIENASWANAGVRIFGQTPERANKLAQVVRSIVLTKNSRTTGL